MRTKADRGRGYALAFETSGAIGGVALGRGGEVLEARVLGGPRRHAVEFLPVVAALCEVHGVEPDSVGRIYLSAGPGSFTGLRIGVTAARMIALATAARVVAVPTLEAIAQNATDLPAPPNRVAVLLDAGRGRVYAAEFVFRTDRYGPVAAPVEADPSRFLAERAGRKGGSRAVLGEGVLRHRAAVEASGWSVLPESLHRPRVETVYRLGLALADADAFTDRRVLIPTYVRPPEAEEKWEQRQSGRGP